MNSLLPQLLNDCHTLLGDDFIFQQDGAPAHTARQFVQNICPNFIAQKEWPPNSPDLNSLYYSFWGMMLDRYGKLQSKPTSIAELRTALQEIWDALPHTPIQKAICSFRK